MNTKLKTVIHQADVCVVGGGLAGVCAAISAARHGAKVVLMQDRPVLGGNASSEIKMWVSGAGSRVRNLQETGIIEEILLENMHRNPARSFTLWDALLYEKVKFQENITLLLNCACCDAEMDGNRIKSVTGFQLTTYTWQKVEAPIFCDCSGDSILAPLTGAEYMVGREAKETFGEEFGLEEADKRTMGMSLMIQCHETEHPVSFTPPAWAYTFKTDEEMHHKPHECLTKIHTNFYWIELGGEMNTIDDTEEIRDELLKIAFGVWDHMKNWGDHGAENWELDWIGFLPGKRESRRYVGDYVLNQNDVEQHPCFPDEVAYGGWQIDNHLPGGFFMSGNSGNHLQKRRLTEPYGIPFRCLYSRNIDNLMMAGRNISASHIAFASSRVMATCAVIGQAVGTAAALATAKGVDPKKLFPDEMSTLQKQLMDDDCFLPHYRRTASAICRNAKLSCDYGDCSAILNGLDRRIWGNDNGYYGKVNNAITYTFDKPTHLSSFRLICDSDLDREYVEGNPDVVNISTCLARRLDYNNTTFGFPRCMLTSFKLEARNEAGEWTEVYRKEGNIMRLVRDRLVVTCSAIRFVPLATYHTEHVMEYYGSAQAHIFSFEVE